MQDDENCHLQPAFKTSCQCDALIFGRSHVSFERDPCKLRQYSFTFLGLLVVDAGLDGVAPPPDGDRVPDIVIEALPHHHLAIIISAANQLIGEVVQSPG